MTAGQQQRVCRQQGGSSGVAMNRDEIEAAAPGAVLHDDQVPGLKLRAFEGRRSWYLYYRTKAGKRRAPKLGDYPLLSITKARTIAREMMGEVHAGRDPAAERRRQIPTVNDLCDQFVERHVALKKPSTQTGYAGLIRRTIRPKLGKRDVDSIDIDDIEAVMRGLKRAPYEANRTLAVLRKMFNLAEKWRLRPLGSNPCRHVEAYRERPRQRPLEPQELPRFAQVLDELEQGHPRAVALLRVEILTGARGCEIRTARWDELGVGALRKA
ncbi:MAG: integrase family protein, partial [Pseudomonadota bacterium]